MTSRKQYLAPNEDLHALRPLNEEESLDLLQRQLLGGNGWPTGLCDLGIQIARICKGLPLTILIIAGVVARTKPAGWKEILGALRSHNLSSIEHCWEILELSYNHLPEHLRPCFVYFVAFQEDEEKAQDEGFASIMGRDVMPLEFHVTQGLWRLCICSNTKHLIRSSKPFPHLRSLRFSYYECRVPQYLTLMIQVCRLLRVLDLGKINIGHAIPSEIGSLMQLAFLAIRGYMRDIPSSIGNLSNLQTFILIQMSGDIVLSLPNSFWNLRKLKHLSMKSPGGILPMENLTSSSDICELDWISGVIIPYQGSMEELVKRFPNIRKLKCALVDCHDTVENHVKVLVPKFLSQLESLGFHLSSRSLSTISELQNLEVLKFDGVSFEGDSWEMEEGEFSKLKHLEVVSLEASLLEATEDQFVCLEKLVFSSCSNLKEMPSCLDTVATLEVIQVFTILTLC
ncbi:OLC1v1008895C1 [Oldenlandia corymbosa var. corymbosa]|uniref:OLC1v1008895C1 n=1 Tax=Oldenlandia corymbosa var. corymbosa TaxID=529605 RepID=A0AAV1DML6_OLDCO|nr:OLC1v1008895C1 [Oldenlandia corymbosa var. corymbosa]